MKKVAVVSALIAVWFALGGAALAQDKSNPLPLGDFVALFTDEEATSANSVASSAVERPGNWRNGREVSGLQRASPGRDGSLCPLGCGGETTSGRQIGGQERSTRPLRRERGG